MPDAQCVVESNFGKARYRVIFGEILCGKRHFPTSGDFTDIDEIELFGLAIHVAKQIQGTSWFLTKEKNLVCGAADKELPVIHVNIDIKENLDWLVSPLLKQKLKPGYGFKVLIAGLDVEDQRSGMWCVFSPTENS